MKRFLPILVFALFASNWTFAEGTVAGFVLEQDSISPIESAMITFSGIGAEGDTLSYCFYSDSLGFYEADVEAGLYQVFASAEGYHDAYWADSLLIAEGDSIANINFILNELNYPVQYVDAQIFTDDYVLVSWSFHEPPLPEGLPERSFQYFDLFRRYFDEAPVLLASHISDTSFMEMNWNNLAWGKYGWGVSCYYEGNRTMSDTIWSAFLDKDMTTAFEISVTTNIGQVPAGASVLLESYDGQGQSYQASLDENGYLLLPDVYRDDYSLNVHLSGYEDYTSDTVISVFAPTLIEIELQESLMEIDSLYVSSTGWAMWQWPDLQNRDLQYFEIRLDDQLTDTTTQQSYQFDVTHLQPGEHYLAHVRPVFVSGTCEWYTHEWEYHPCSEYPGTAHGLMWSPMDEGVLLSWEYPENEDIIGAMLYRDSTYLGLIEGNAFLDEEVVMHDEVVYCIKLLYDGPLDGTYYSISCEEYVTASFPLYCDPATNLEGENYYESDSNYGALISWGERPPLVEEWLHYDNGMFKNKIGNDGEPILFWAIRFDAEDLLEYQGTALTKVALYDVGAGTYQLWVYVGGDSAPQTLMRYQSVNLHGAYCWHEQLIDPLEIPENESVWVVIGQQGLSRPAAACADMGNPNGRWVSMDGSVWHDMHDFNVHYTWMLRAFVTNHFGKMVPLEGDGLVLQHYNLYRSYDNIDYQQIATIPAVEGQAFYQYQDALVGTTHNRFYYRLTAHYFSDEGEECESDFATSLLFPELNYVEVDDHWSMGEQTKELKVYPNPATNYIRIEAEAMQHLAVYNALGQCLMSVDIEADSWQIGLFNLDNGLYLLHVVTQTGTLTRPFVLSR